MSNFNAQVERMIGAPIFPDAMHAYHVCMHDRINNIFPILLLHREVESTKGVSICIIPYYLSYVIITTCPPMPFHVFQKAYNNKKESN